MSTTLSNQDKELIDAHFRWSELSRHYSPSGIYSRVQAFIDNGLDEARAHHDEDCELKAGRRGCACSFRSPVEADSLT